MDKNIHITRNKILRIYTGVFFVIILVIGILSLSFKFIGENGGDYKKLEVVPKEVKNGVIQIEQIEQFINKQEEKDAKGEDRAFQRRGRFFNYLVINDEKEIIKSQIHFDVDDSELQSYLDVMKMDVTQKRGDILYHSIQIKQGEKFIFVVPLEYPTSYFIRDICIFILLSIVVAFLFFFFSKKLIHRLFIPIEESFNDMKDFVHNAGHEIKTPLSIIDSSIQLMDDNKSYDSELTGDMKQETLKLNKLIDSLLQLTKINPLDGTSEVYLYDCIEDVRSKFKKQIQGKKIDFINNVPEDIRVRANESYVYIFFSNLIGNAIKYNISGGTVHIQGEDNIITIEDSGIGIAKDKLPKIFHRFYKVDTSRSSEGFGIGLALVKKISDIYNWDISVQSKIGRGTTFSIELPKK